MDIQNYTTKHRKGQHLLAEERHEIEVRLKDGWSPYRIAKHLGRASISAMATTKMKVDSSSGHRRTSALWKD